MPTETLKRWPAKAWLLSVAATVGLVALIAPAAASAGGGGVGVGSSQDTVPGNKAKLVHGRAVAPASAPDEVKAVIAAANKIRNKPYKWGGGHGKWKDSGYDCSGSVSYALHGGHLLNKPLDSVGFERYGAKKHGSWITVYGSSSHAYMVVAGLRFDTSMTPGDGPGWSKKMRSTPESYTKRHPRGF